MDQADVRLEFGFVHVPKLARTANTAWRIKESEAVGSIDAHESTGVSMTRARNHGPTLEDSVLKEAFAEMDRSFRGLLHVYHCAYLSVVE
jgi:hypothetical protein